MEKHYYNTNEVVDEIYKAYKKKIYVEDVRLACKSSEVYGFQIDHVRMANRFYITKKGMKELMNYFSEQGLKQTQS